MVNAKRLLAILVAAGMIAGAWFVRTRFIEKGTSTNIDGSSTTAISTPGATRRLICVPELESTCQATGSVFTIESAGSTLAMLGSTANADVTWVTTAPWPELVDAARTRASLPPLPVDQRKPLAGSPVVLAMPADRTATIKAACPTLTWKCIGEKVNRPWKEIGGQAGWQDVTFRHRDPLSSADGLSALGAALAGRAGRTDLSSADLSVNEIRTWTNQVENANKPPSSDPLNAIVLGSRFDMVATIGALVPAAGRVSTITPTPAAQVGVVVMVTSGKIPADLVSSLSAALGKNGWTSGVTASGLPDAVGMEAVQQLWRDVIR